MRVSWQVTGVRKGAWALANPLVVERETTEAERGFYLHPERFGAPLDRTIRRGRRPRNLFGLLVFGAIFA